MKPTLLFRRCALAAAALVLISASAVRAEPDQTAGPGFYRSAETAALGLPFSDAVRVGDLLFLSGQIGTLPGTLDLAPGGVEGQARAAMDHIGRILAEQGLGFEDLAKCTVMLADMADWPAFNSVYVTYFETGRYPARSAFGASGLALGGALEIECMAVFPPDG